LNRQIAAYPPATPSGPTYPEWTFRPSGRFPLSTILGGLPYRGVSRPSPGVKLTKRNQNGYRSTKPTIVLIHGAVEDSSLWTHGVIQRLQREGYPFKVFSNPLRGLAVDVAYLRSLLETIEGPVILVSHAYGGAVITQGGDDPKVKGLIYAGSPMPAVGESKNDCLTRFPGGDFALDMHSPRTVA
jgi:pimeloyl-ACP methyl ester carboxylesterase